MVSINSKNTLNNRKNNRNVQIIKHHDDFTFMHTAQTTWAQKNTVDFGIFVFDYRRIDQWTREELF